MNDIIITEKTLDVRKVFSNKAPVLSKWIPGFVYSFIERKVHQKEMNAFLFENKDKYRFEFLDAIVDYLELL